MWAALAIGFLFGVCLQRGGLTRYQKIADAFRFRDLTVLRFMLSAILVAALGVHVLAAFGVARPLPLHDSALLRNALGGLVFGVGMALVGLCPGTVVAGAGEGRLDDAIPGVLGLVAGSLAFGLAYPTLVPALERHLRLGPVNLPGLAGVDPWLALALLWELALIGFAVGASRLPHSQERP